MSRRGRRGKTDERVCAVEGCEKRAKPGSLHCLGHGQSAVGQAARRELKDLVGELAKLSEVSDPKLRRRADMRFMTIDSRLTGTGVSSMIIGISLVCSLILRTTATSISVTPQGLATLLSVMSTTNTSASPIPSVNIF